MRKVERTPAGKFKVRFRGAKRDGTHGQTSETFDRAAEARDFAKWLDALGVQGALDQLYESEQDNSIPTLDELAASHIENLTGIESGTRKTYTRLWGRTWSPLIGSVRAHHITKDQVSRAVNTLAETYSGKSLQNQRGLLAGVLDRSVEHGYLAKNPAKGIRLPRTKESDRVEMRPVTPTEFADILERIPEHYQPFLRFLYGTGARWGEAVALQVQDVQLPNVRIRRALKWSPDNDRKVGATKTTRGNRTVVIGDVMLADLRAACEGKAGTDLVFTAHRGGPILHRTFWSRYWIPAVTHLTPRPRLHDLRHGHASWLLAQGVPIHVVSRRLGHNNIQVTVDTYAHLVPDAQNAAAAAAELAFTARPAIEG